MPCPTCREQLDTALFHGIEVDYCPVCLGMFFEEDELRLAKDDKDANLNWLDLELWQKQDKLEAARRGPDKLCPNCRLPLYEVGYGDSDIKVDVCRACKGIWLDRGEFKKIIEYLQAQANWILINQWVKALRQEAWEVFAGPENFKEELSDFLTLVKLLAYKFPRRQ